MSPSVFSSSLFQPEFDSEYHTETSTSATTQPLRRNSSGGNARDRTRSPSKFVRKLYK